MSSSSSSSSMAANMTAGRGPAAAVRRRRGATRFFLLAVCHLHDRHSVVFVHPRQQAFAAAKEVVARKPRILPTSWSYLYHGQDWAERTYGNDGNRCGSRERQSPIDFDQMAPWDENPSLGQLPDSFFLVDYYKQEELLAAAGGAAGGNKAFLQQPQQVLTPPPFPSVPVQGDSHGVSVRFSGYGLGGIVFEDINYNLVSMNVHAKSEHTFHGKHYPLELHLVHKRDDSEALLVVALPVNVTAASGGKTSAAGAALGGFLDAVAGKVKPGEFSAALDLTSVKSIGDFFSDPDSDFFRYKGSFTVPPCTETVTWFVKREPVIIAGGAGASLDSSASALSVLRESIYSTTLGNGNFRSTMPRSGRPISVARAFPKDAYNADDYTKAPSLSSGGGSAAAFSLQPVATPAPKVKHHDGDEIVGAFAGDEVGLEAMNAGRDALASATLLGETLRKSSEQDVVNLAGVAR